MISTAIKRVVWIAMIAAGLGLWSSASVRSGTTEAISGASLVEALRRGGFNIYFRHAATDWSAEDQVTAEGDWKSCDPSRMRQLSDRGRHQAGRIGSAIRRLQIPVSRLYSSEYCRTRETALSMNLRLPVKTTRALMNMRAASFVGGTEALVARARQFLSIPPPEGTNAVFVAHGNLMRATSGAYTGEAGAVVFAPRGGGRIDVAAQLDPEQWETLARRFGRP